MLLDDLGLPVDLSTGTVTLADGSGVAVQVFTNRNGRFAVSGLQQGEYILRLSDGREMRFTVDEGDIGLKRIGELRLERQR